MNLPSAALVDTLRAAPAGVERDHAIVLLSRLTVGELHLVAYLIILLPEAEIRRLLASLEL